MDYNTRPVTDNYSTSGVAISASNMYEMPPVDYSNVNAPTGKNFSKETIAFSLISLISFGLWTLFNFIIATTLSIVATGDGLILAWWIITVYCIIKCILPVSLIISSNRKLRALLFLTMAFLGFLCIIECILLVVFFLESLFNIEFAPWFFLLWAITELITIITLIISGIRLRYIIKTQFGLGVYVYQDLSNQISQNYSYSDSQYTI